MTTTPISACPISKAAQAQKHVTHNEALRILDAVMQICVLDATAPRRRAPAEGARHVVALRPPARGRGMAMPLPPGRTARGGSGAEDRLVRLVHRR